MPYFHVRITTKSVDHGPEVELDAARNKEDTIMAHNVMTGPGIQTTNRGFVEPGDRRSEPHWKHALEELEQNGLVEALGYKGEIFQVTHAGFAMADTINESQKAFQREYP